MGGGNKALDRVKDLDLYELFDIPIDSEEKAIKKAYRKKALSCHPDKNPDNPKAAEEFHTLSDAYEILTDPDAKKAYDNVLKARKANAVRNKQLDAKRRKLKDDLEAREREAKFQAEFNQKSEEEKLKEELARLNKEGSRLLEEEQEKMRKEIEEEKKRKSQNHQQSEGGKLILRVKWKENKDNHYDQERLHTIFNKYGHVTNVVLKKKEKKCSALIEMESRNAAMNAAKIENGIKFKIQVLDENGKELDLEKVAFSNDYSNSNQKSFSHSSGSDLVGELDFESVVMANLRRAEARKKEIERLKREEEESLEEK